MVVFNHGADDAAQVAVVDANTDEAGYADELGMFVHIHITLRPVIFLDGFVFHLAHTVEGELA